MADVLLVLCIPLTVCAGGVYAVCESWWRRRRPARTSPYPARCTHAAARAAEREMLVEAADIVQGAYARFAGLYDADGPQQARRAAGAAGSTNTAASRGCRDADRVTSPAGSSAGHGPSSPAPDGTPERPPAG
ncbi:hypothetical protein [Streptomyces sp. NPDC059176]|uniref:hypothetical protein n=1 Tax=Streptomyces sp. NPDC059176 TaxID=3346758 RepID=UPI00368A90EC